MSVNLLKNPFFEDASTLAFWDTSGVTSNPGNPQAFEGENVAQLGPVTADGEVAIISQRVLLPSGTTHLHVSFAVQAALINVTPTLTAPWRVTIQWLGSGGTPVLLEETLIQRQAGMATRDANDWLTYVAVSGPKPTGAVYARLRFILQGDTVGTTNFFQGIQIDDVVLTTD
ncbi:hypothetical protein [Polycladomyces subterraneus]|uniref:CBM-cenC domain-containing protein n=1 Tax=Polycladomyces subterraneus TaxID=1016997 RepID=A0ABT8IL71_9BACL|nr:hypothetical protein [Polycladomyces subterraneus]MDN4593494.1 hypothetical protein [Polycladomyces subterraneus]